MANTTAQPPVTVGTALAGTGVSIEIEGVVKRYRTSPPSTTCPSPSSPASS